MNGAIKVLETVRCFNAESSTLNALHDHVMFDTVYVIIRRNAQSKIPWICCSIIPYLAVESVQCYTAEFLSEN